MRNARVSYRALALADGLPVQIFKECPAHKAAAGTSRNVFPLPSLRNGSGHASAAYVELMGIEPTASGLQNRRSPS